MAEAAPIYDVTELTRYIETRYHARHREQLPRLVKLAEMVEDLHCDDDGVPKGLSGLLAGMVGKMEVHMKKEELILFPAIRKGGGSGIEHPIAVIRVDHDGHEREVDQIRRLTQGMTPPEGACTSWATLYAGLAEFVDDLTEHIRLENDVLFPKVQGWPWSSRGEPRVASSQEGDRTMRKTSAMIMCAAALAAGPAIAQDATQDSESWLPSLMTDTPAEGFDLALSMARKAVTTTQTDVEALHALRPNYSHDPQSLIEVSGVVAQYFATVAAANDYWRE
ncbi:MAG TPA: hexameric tyrosine-coordinated heme protein [Amaricoccus sp.]|nr:hexameric tyrosine-coordinated heme protein [Amaricoccus sp.]HMT99076.1 hexameric tyrosine-coordinated heme protein [Amaricoccus sp.]